MSFSRTPKQKLKFKVTSDSLLRKLEGGVKDPRKELKVKEASQMSHIVSVVTDQIHEMKAIPTEVTTDLDDDTKGQDPNVVLKKNLLQLVAVLQQGGQFRGFNRKIQLRPLKWTEVPCSPTLSSQEETRCIEVDKSQSCDSVPDVQGPSDPQEIANVKPLPGADEEVVSHTPPVPILPFELRRGVEKVGNGLHCHVDHREAGQARHQSPVAPRTLAFRRPVTPRHSVP